MAVLDTVSRFNSQRDSVELRGAWDRLRSATRSQSLSSQRLGVTYDTSPVPRCRIAWVLRDLSTIVDHRKQSSLFRERPLRVLTQQRPKITSTKQNDPNAKRKLSKIHWKRNDYTITFATLVFGDVFILCTHNASGMVFISWAHHSIPEGSQLFQLERRNSLKLQVPNTFRILNSESTSFNNEIKYK